MEQAASARPKMSPIGGNADVMRELARLRMERLRLEKSGLDEHVTNRPPLRMRRMRHGRAA